MDFLIFQAEHMFTVSLQYAYNMLLTNLKLYMLRNVMLMKKRVYSNF